MKTFLQMLFYGYLKPADEAIPESREQKMQRRKTEAVREKLYSRLNENERKLFEKYEDERNEEEDLRGEALFSHGFRLACILLTEVFGDDSTSWFMEGYRP